MGRSTRREMTGSNGSWNREKPSLERVGVRDDFYALAGHRCRRAGESARDPATVESTFTTALSSADRRTARRRYGRGSRVLDTGDLRAHPTGSGRAPSLYHAAPDGLFITTGEALGPDQHVYGLQARGLYASARTPEWKRWIGSCGRSEPSRTGSITRRGSA